MGKYLPLLLAALIFASCRSAWSEADDVAFNKACMDDARTWAPSPTAATTYCKLVIAKVKEKYPNENEAMKNIVTLAADKDVQACKDSILIKKQVQ